MTPREAEMELVLRCLISFVVSLVTTLIVLRIVG
jgi:hypothetical protein